MHFRGLLSVVVGLTAVAGCSREGSVTCDTDVRYASARSSQPVQIPDDLSPPNETDAIRLPPDTGAVASLEAGKCIEDPPPFFGDSRSFGTSSDESEPPRQSRREARRAARAETPASEPGDAPAEPREPAPAPSAPAPAGDDRVIDN
jgi:hypothetical protein